jgi:Fe-S cluster biogenesis protein NfuA
LISDGGNVSVDRVEQDTMDIYLKLEGACGSCPSSTVTMKMGIERVLKENFPDLNEVKQVEDEDANPKELTLEAVEAGLNRIKPAIIAMGGSVRIIGVDSVSGEVVLEFRGANKVRGGLELAILEVEFVNTVTFKMLD